MAPRRASRSVKPVENNNYINLKINDVLCPICRSILIEPVTLPCNHSYCLNCFNSTIANTNLVCPLCRVRISSWLRIANKEKKLVNINLWKAIKESFPQQVNNKLNDIDENLEEVVCTVRLASPGALRREYEEEKEKTELELKKQKEAEVKASEALIKKLAEQEKYEVALRKEKIKLDEQVAKQLAKDFSNNIKPSSSKVNTPKRQNQIDQFLNSKTQVHLTKENFANKEFTTRVLCQKRKTTFHPIHNINKNILIQKTLKEAEIRNSNDSIEAECCYFKSIDHRNIPPSKAIPMIKIPTKIANASTVIIGAPEGDMHFKHFTKSPFIHLQKTNGNSFQLNSVVDLTENENIRIPTFAKNINHNIKQNITHLPVKRRTINKVEVPERISPRKRRRVIYTETSPIDEIDIQKMKDNDDSNMSVSPPFYGFDNNQLLKSVKSQVCVRSNGSLNATVTKLNGDIDNCDQNELISKRQEQEKNDLEFAKRLHEQLNSSTRQWTRKSTNNVQAVKKRCSKQMTLDHMIASQSLK